MPDKYLFQQIMNSKRWIIKSLINLPWIKVVVVVELPSVVVVVDVEGQIQTVVEAGVVVVVVVVDSTACLFILILCFKIIVVEFF